MTRAFTLVELSIVLVILGLLVGGVLAGQNLIRAAELRSVTTEYNQFQTAVMTFREKYFALPGDMTNATAFWGTMATGTCPNATAGTGTQTCDGDGDGAVESGGATGQFKEMFGFWQQLTNAGLIEGEYTGIAGSGGNSHAIADTNIPVSRVDQGGWNIINIATQLISSTNYYEGAYGNILALGSPVTNNVTTDELISAEEAWNIDTKLDDGKPGTGRLRTRETHGSATAGQGCGNAAASSSSALAATVEYDLQNTSAACSLLFTSGF